MNFTSLLGAILPLEVPSSYPELEPIINFLNESIIPLTVILCVLGAVFAVAVTFLIIKAESVEQAETMKKRLIHLAITMLCFAATLWIFAIVLKNLDGLISTFRGE